MWRWIKSIFLGPKVWGKIKYICQTCGYEERVHSPESDVCFRCQADDWEEVK